MTQPVIAPHRREAYPLAWIRGQYPALHAEAETDHVSLDNALGSQLPQAVIDAGVHTLTTRAAKRVTAAKEVVRAQVAAFLNTPGPRNVIFGPNAATLLELLAQSFGCTLKAGDELMVSGSERGGAVRLSILHYNSAEDIDAALTALADLI